MTSLLTLAERAANGTGERRRELRAQFVNGGDVKAFVTGLFESHLGELALPLVAKVAADLVGAGARRRLVQHNQDP